MRTKVLKINELNINKHKVKPKVKCSRIPHYAYTRPLCVMPQLFFKAKIVSYLGNIYLCQNNRLNETKV